MEYFKDLRESRIIRLVENKDRFIQKSTVLTDEQKKEVLDFFHSHANLENRIQNWNYNIPYETFKQVINSVDTAKKRLKKQTKELRQQSGLGSLVEKEDYNLIYQDDSITIYQPLTHKASRVIASNTVEPKIWCESSIMDWSPKEILPEGEPMKDDLYPGAKWCISMETDKHWNNYTGDGKRFFIICNPKARTEKGKKVCLTYNSSNKFEVFTYADDSSTKRVPRRLVEIIDAYFKERLQKYLNKETERYDYLNREFTPWGLIENGKFIVPIGIWEGDFDCSHGNLTSLEGAPEIVEGDFNCIGNKLTSLEGAPREVSGDFKCEGTYLTSLQGAPREVGGNFDCDFNYNLTSLEGAPEKIGGSFWCVGNRRLTSLKGAPRVVGNDFNCSKNNLTSLEGAPEYVSGNFTCDYNQLTSLQGAPREVGGEFGCINNQLISLEGAPRKVGRTFYCYNNKLASLQGAPEEVGGSFSCSNNPLGSLEGKPEHIGGKFFN